MVKTAPKRAEVQRARQESARLPAAAVRRQNSKAALKVMQINTDMIILCSSGL